MEYPHSLDRLTGGSPWLWCCLAFLLLLLSSMAAHAQSLESILSPGKLKQGHARFEDDCKQCHVKMDRSAQPGLCMSCHKPVGADVRGKTGFHGRMPQPLVCKNCHTDHQGRDLKTAVVNTKTFDHGKTDYALHGKHEKVACESCHVAGKKYWDAPQDCNSCHKKDDPHKGSLGTQCADCHTDSNWKEARFDHSTTQFALTGKHTEVSCASCHKDGVYKDTPKNCYACHRKIDDQKGHKGLFGEKCESCHGTKAWKPSSFNHDTDTKFVLRGGHRATACASCHVGGLFKTRLQQDCVACHKKDDKHKESLGPDCASCHTEKNWKEVGKFDHEKTRFPLAGKHARVDCSACHESPVFKDAPRDCIGCHQKDDRHKATLGTDCASCHGVQDWMNTQGRFAHEKTRFPLRNAHATPAVTCASCHKDLASMRNTALACVACHKKDDKHEGQLGEGCDSCHGDKSWKGTNFNHGKSRFPLTGRHLVTDCKSCHTTQRFRDAPRDCFSCHKKDDRHAQALGVSCASCHSTRAWSTWSFDHNLRTKYRLEAAHAKATCVACHKQPAPAGMDAAPLDSHCVSCHRGDDAHSGALGPRCEQCHRVEGWKKVKVRVGPGTAP